MVSGISAGLQLTVFRPQQKGEACGSAALIWKLKAALQLDERFATASDPSSHTIPCTVQFKQEFWNKDHSIDARNFELYERKCLSFYFARDTV